MKTKSKLPKNINKAKVEINPHLKESIKIIKDFGDTVLIDAPVQYLSVGLEIGWDPRDPKEYYLTFLCGKGADHEHLMLDKEKAIALKKAIDKFLKVIPD